jgi:hypothetical protein
VTEYDAADIRHALFKTIIFLCTFSEERIPADDDKKDPFFAEIDGEPKKAHQTLLFEQKFVEVCVDILQHALVDNPQVKKAERPNVNLWKTNPDVAIKQLATNLSKHQPHGDDAIFASYKFRLLFSNVNLELPQNVHIGSIMKLIYKVLQLMSKSNSR